LGKIKIRNYTYGLAVTIVALGLYSYYVRELLASLLLFSVLFLVMGLIVLGGVLAWYAGKQVALWSRLVSQNEIAFAQHTAPVGGQGETTRNFRTEVSASPTQA
jgi:hypothetical protein